MKPIFIRSPYNYDQDEVSNATGIGNFPETLTQQQFKDECNINRIVAQFSKGVEPIGNALQPLPEGHYPLTSFQDAQNTVRRAQESFNSLSAHVRAQFNNDPGLFVDFVTNPANLESVRDLGLAPKGKPVEVTPETSPSPTP